MSSRYLPKYGPNVGENLIAGFNLHYLPLNLVRAFIKAQTFQSEMAVRAGLRHPVIKRAYRSYKIRGVSNARRIDWKSFLDKVSITRQLKPQEREQLIAMVEAQLVSNFRDMASINQLVSRFMAGRSQARPVPSVRPAQPPGETGPSPTS